MAQFGNMNPEEKELDDIAGRDIATIPRRSSKNYKTQLISQKLLAFYKENMSFKTKEVSYEGLY